MSDNGKLIMPSVRTYTFSLQPINKWQTGVTLPTTKPIPGQFTVNIDNTTIPISKPSILSMRYVPLIIACGQNNSGVSATVSYEILRNGATISSGTSSSIANASYWCFEHMKETYTWQTQIGDSFELRLYASTSGITLDGYHCLIYPSRQDLGLGSNYILKDCTLTTANFASPQVGFSYTNPNNGKSLVSSWGGSVFIYPTTTTQNTYSIQTGIQYPAIYPHPTNKMGDVQGGINFASVGFGISTSQYSIQHTNFLYNISTKVVYIT